MTSLMLAVTCTVVSRSVEAHRHGPVCGEATAERDEEQQHKHVREREKKKKRKQHPLTPTLASLLFQSPFLGDPHLLHSQPLRVLTRFVTHNNSPSQPVRTCTLPAPRGRARCNPGGGGCLHLARPRALLSTMSQPSKALLQHRLFTTIPAFPWPSAPPAGQASDCQSGLMFSRCYCSRTRLLQQHQALTAPHITV